MYVTFTANDGRTDRRLATPDDVTLAVLEALDNLDIELVRNLRFSPEWKQPEPKLEESP